jgi:hypothetical protein
MCTGAEMMMGGTLFKGVSDLAAGEAQNTMAKAAAAGERDAASQQADRILRATQRQRGAARAATAGSGARVDAFSLANEQEIVQAGETDAAMEILTGKRRGRSLEIEGQFARAAGLNSMGSSLFSASAQYKNWVGTKQQPAPVEDRSFYSYAGDRPNRAGR